MELSQAQIVDFKECFSMYDKDHDGNITVKELGTVMRALNVAPSEKEIKELLTEHHGSGGGGKKPNNLIDFPLFLTLMAKKMKTQENDEQATKILKALDKKGTGNVDIRELKRMMSSLGEPLTDKDIDDILEDLDMAGQTQVPLEDFIRALLQ